jgi:hypothetical protein
VQFVRKIPPYNSPNSDILIPGRVSDDIGFVDSGMELDGQRGPLRLYLSATGIRRAANQFPQLGLVDKAKHDDAVNLVMALKNKVLELEEEVAELRAIQDRIAGLHAAGFTVQKKAGRPKEKVE